MNSTKTSPPEHFNICSIWLNAQTMHNRNISWLLISKDESPINSCFCCLHLKDMHLQKTSTPSLWSSLSNDGKFQYTTCMQLLCFCVCILLLFVHCAPNIQYHYLCSVFKSVIILNIEQWHHKYHIYLQFVRIQECIRVYTRNHRLQSKLNIRKCEQN